MKNLLLLFALGLFLFQIKELHAQVFQQWDYNYSGPENKSDNGQDIIVDNDNNIIAVGVEDDEDAFVGKWTNDGSLLWTAKHNGSANATDVFYAVAVDGDNNIYAAGISHEIASSWDIVTNKYNADGILQWSKLKNGTSNVEENATDIAVDPFGNIYTAGYLDQIDGGQDYCVIKYDSDGNELWTQTWGGAAGGSDVVYDMAIDFEGNVLLNGRMTSGGDSLDDFATLKYNPEGVLQWVKTYHQIYGETGFTIDVDGEGNIYAGGWAADGASMGESLIIKYDPDGNTLWEERYHNGLGGVSEAWVLRTFEDVIYMGGSSIDWDLTGQDFMVLKYDADGNLLWDVSYDHGLNKADYLTSMDIDNEGNIIGSGLISDFTSGDILTVKFNPEGEVIWAITYNGDADSYDEAWGVTTDNDGNVFVTGFDINEGVYSDFVVIKYGEQLVESIHSNTNHLQLYPVPASDVLFVDATINNANVFILNTLGQIVYQQNINYNSQSIDVSAIPAGSYIIKFVAGEKTFIGTCIIQ
jgi:uncharacterized delta-60 repeat protein